MGSNLTFQSRNVLSKKFMSKGEHVAAGLSWWNAGCHGGKRLRQYGGCWRYVAAGTTWWHREHCLASSWP